MNIDLKHKLFEQCLHDMKDILDKCNQHFFLCCGTLLGQQRENNFIAYDEDIDIGIINTKYNPNILLYILQSKKFQVHSIYGNVENSLEISFRHITGVKIDIFIFYPILNEKDYYYIATFNGICNTKPEGFCKWARHIRGFKEITFKGKIYNIPNNAEEYLIETYGSDWKTPKQFSYWEALAGECKNMMN